MSWRHKRWSKETDSVNWATSAAGPDSNRQLRDTTRDFLLRFTGPECGVKPGDCHAPRIVAEKKGLSPSIVCGKVPSEPMSEFKFACPVCGQHITVDSSTSGGRIDCPTCFRKIVVPQAPAGADSKLIISASQADKPRPPQGTPLTQELLPAPRRSFPVAAIFLVLLLAGGLTAFAFRGKLREWMGYAAPGANKKEPEPGKALKKTYPIPTDFAWTLDLSKIVIPEKIASGGIHGEGFRCERSTLQGGTLTLRQGRSGPADLGITIHLFAQQGEQLSGKTIEITPDRSPPLPKITLRWKDEQDKAVTQNLSQGYALRVAFGEPIEDRMPGRIYVCLPDEAKSFVAGTFNAEIRKPSPPKAKKVKKSP